MQMLFHTLLWHLRIVGVNDGEVTFVIITGYVNWLMYICDVQIRTSIHFSRMCTNCGSSPLPLPLPGVLSAAEVHAEIHTASPPVDRMNHTRRKNITFCSTQSVNIGQ